MSVGARDGHQNRHVDAVGVRFKYAIFVFYYIHMYKSFKTLMRFFQIIFEYSILK